MIGLLRHLSYALATLAGIAATLFIGATVLGEVGILAVLGLSVRGIVVFGVVTAVSGALATLYLGKDVTIWSLKTRPLGPDEAGLAMGRGGLALPAILQRLTGQPALGHGQTVDLQVYDSDSINAVVIGHRRRGALVAVSSGLLRQATPEQAEAILAQGLAKLAGGDGPALLLCQGMILPFTLFPARMLALLLGTSLRTSEETTPSDPVEVGMVLVLEVLLTGFGSLVVRQFARRIETAADRRAGALVGTSPLISAIEAATGDQTLPHRERFSLPFTFGARVGTVQAPFSYHRPAARRQAALAL